MKMLLHHRTPAGSSASSAAWRKGYRTRAEDGRIKGRDVCVVSVVDFQ